MKRNRIAVIAIIFIIVTIILAIGSYGAWQDVQQAEEEAQQALRELKIAYDECIAAGGGDRCNASTIRLLERKPELEPLLREYGIPIP